MSYKLDNETKIQFFNAVWQLEDHRKECPKCETYHSHGKGDLCERGKEIIAIELAYSDTKIKFSQP